MTLSLTLLAVALVPHAAPSQAPDRSVVHTALYRMARIDPYPDLKGHEPYRYLDVEDTALIEGPDESSFGASPELTLRPGQRDRLLIAFRMLFRAIPPGSRVLRARLELVVREGAASNGGLVVTRLARRWHDGGADGSSSHWAATWRWRLDDREGRTRAAMGDEAVWREALMWREPGASCAGVDRAPSPSLRLSSLALSPLPADRRPRPTWRERGVPWQGGERLLVLESERLTEDVRYWLERHYENFGWVIERDDPGAGPLTILTSDCDQPSMRPRLVVETVPAGTPPLQRGGPPADRTDLDVTFIERLPRLHAYKDMGTGQYERKSFRGEDVGIMIHPLYGALPKWPAEGQEVTFVAHVKNSGGMTFDGTFRAEWRLNGMLLGEDRFEGRLGPGEGRTFRLPWRWHVDHSDHRDLFLTFGVDPDEQVGAELTRQNDWLGKYVESRTVQYWVEEKARDFIRSHRNAYGSYSFEDYLQWHFQVWNETFFDKSRFPDLAPEGGLERVSVDRINVVATGRLDRFGRHLPKPDLDAPDGKDTVDPLFDGEWGSAWVRTSAEDAAAERANLESFLGIHQIVLERSLLHELSHQTVAAFDVYWSNMEPSRPREAAGKVRVRDGGETFITRGSRYAWAGLMGGGDTRPLPTWREGTGLYCAHSIYGFNSNLPYRNGFYGEWQYDVPERLGLRVLDGRGRPLAGAAIKVWQAAAMKIEDGNVVAGGLHTDRQGQVELPQQDTLEEADVTVLTGHTLAKKNPFGRINVVGTNTNLLVRIEALGQRDYRFVNLLDVNKAFWRGRQDQIVLDLPTRIAGARPDFSTDLSRRARVEASRGKETAALALDGDPETAWAGGDCVAGDHLVIDLGGSRRVALVRLAQDDRHGGFFRRFVVLTSDRSEPPERPGDWQLFGEQLEHDFGYAIRNDSDCDPDRPSLRVLSYGGGPVRCRWIRLEAEQDGRAALTELHVYPVMEQDRR